MSGGERVDGLDGGRGERFGRYLLLDRIDVGGMAEVFRGRMAGAEGFERMVALKRILPSVAADPDFIEMFVDEAKLAVQLRHPNIAQIHELGVVEAQHFIALEYVAGVSLRTLWDRARSRGRLLPVALSCHVVREALAGLDAAHRKRDDRTGAPLHLVHRDVSPQNILVSFEGDVKVIDFGIAKAANKISKTQAGVLKGKFGYMSPEQVRGLPLDHRADVFAAGVVLHELLTGDRLFAAGTEFATLERIRRGEVAPPSASNPDVPDALDPIVLRALERDRERRFRSAGEMADALSGFLFGSGRPGPGRSVGREDVAQYMRRHFAVEIRDEQARAAADPPRSPDPWAMARAVSDPSLPAARGRPVPADGGSAAPPRAPSTGAPPGPAASSLGGAESGRSLDADPPPEISTSAGRSGFVAPVDDDELPDEASGAAVVDPAERPAARSRRSPVLIAAVTGAVAALAVVAVLAVGWTLLRPAAGDLVLRIHPPAARVWLDERLVGQGSPIELEDLETGLHVVEVRHPGYAPQIKPVRVRPGETLLLDLRLIPERRVDPEDAPGSPAPPAPAPRSEP